jgi:hypothetical protein
LATSAAIVTAVAGTLTSMLEGEHVVVSDNPEATVMAARSVANSELDKDNDPAAPAISETAASSMLEKGSAIKRNQGYWYSGVIRGITTRYGLWIDSLTFAT